MDPTTGALILGGISSIGGLLQGKQAQKMSEQQIGLEELLGMRGLDIQGASVGNQLRRQMESMPLRDRLLYQLNARMGQSPQRFNPSGLFQNAAQGANTGGIDFNALNQASAAYTPGAGGTRPDLAASMLGKLGYDAKSGQPTGINWSNAYMQGNTGVTNTGVENLPSWQAKAKAAQAARDRIFGAFKHPQQPQPNNTLANFQQTLANRPQNKLQQMMQGRSPGAITQ